MDEREVRERLRLLHDEHRALDTVLVASGEIGAADLVGRMRAKKLKLRLRDEIALLESMLIPDILA